MDQGDGEEVEFFHHVIDVVRSIHAEALEVGGGVPGEEPSLFSACARPFHSAFGELIYKTPCERAAALFFGIICDHAFVDGNKRTGTFAAMWLLASDGFLEDVTSATLAQRDALGELALVAARGDISAEAVIESFRRIFEAE